MKLTTQAFIVIFCPVAFQLLLVATLLILIAQAQQDAERNIHSESVMNECNLIVMRVFEGVGALAMLHKQQASLLTPSVGEAKDAFQAQVDKVHDLIVNDPLQADNDALFLREAQGVADLTEKIHPHGTYDSSTAARHLLVAISRIIQTEGQKMQVATKVKEDRRNLAKVVLISFAAFGIVVSAVVAIVCALRLKRMIAHMTENAGRFARREPLEPPLEGTDEVARVDQNIHAMDVAIEEILTKARNLIDNAADLVCSVDRDGYFLRVNRFCRRLLGREPETLIDTPVIDLVINEDCALADEQINKSFESILGNQFELRLKFLEDRIVDTSWSTFYSRQDKSLFCVVADVTERKNIERLKQDFIGMISHDLRTPLMSIASSIALVQSGALGNCSESVMRDLNGAEKTVDRLIAMINDLLDFEKMEAGKMQFNMAPVEMDEVIQEAFREVETLAGSKRIRLETDGSGVAVSGDREKLIQLLVNLLGNAIRYSPEGAPVTVQCRQTNQTAEISVRDEGPGVPEGFHESVFAPFESAPGSKQTSEGGTGLGLAICKLITEGHNGEIGVRNRKERGSEFWFKLSAAKKNAAR
jgi:PAS domain S-box-containing protein